MHLFRIDSVATKFFGLWNRTVGDEYLKRILGTFQKYFNVIIPFFFIFGGEKFVL